MKIKINFENVKSNMPLFDGYKRFGKVAYEMSDITFIRPMDAKEILNDSEKEKIFNDSNYVVEEKFDGTRGLLYFFNVEDNREGFMRYCAKYNIPKDVATILMFKDNEKIRSMLFDSCNKAETFLSSNIIKGLVNDRSFYNEFTDTLYMFNADDSLTVEKNAMLNLETDVFEGTKYENISFYIWKAFCLGVYVPRNTYTRCFSRRISKKTDWFVENTDSIPKLRDLSFKGSGGLILDGELFIPNKGFKYVSSVLNCTTLEAVKRQHELGTVVFHAFDCLFYQFNDIREDLLHERKRILRGVFDEYHFPYDSPIELVESYSCLGASCNVEKYVVKCIQMLKDDDFESIQAKYPSAYSFLKEHNSMYADPQTFYELIVMSGGEGVMVKDLYGVYRSSRGREYQKVKKVLTKDVIILGFEPPTKEYEGKFLNNEDAPLKWRYWEYHGRKFDTKYPDELKYILDNIESCTAVTKQWFNNQIGKISFGVIVKDRESVKSLPWKAKKESYKYKDGYYIIPVGECDGISDDERAMFSLSCDEFIGNVIEVECNEIFKETGKLRHPRFLRLRPDKDWKSCDFFTHIGGDDVEEDNGE